METREISTSTAQLLLLLTLSYLVGPSSSQGSTTMTTPSSVASTSVASTTNPRIVEHPEDQYVARSEPATLNCKAEGTPTPVITWYKDGQPVVTANENPASHRMLLPSGQLFFLRVYHSKNSRSDVGTYYCNATNPDTKFSVVSRTAKLEIAVMRDEFREQPQSVDVSLGSLATLGCRPPRGEPEPRVRWQKDGEPLKTSDRVTVDDLGGLTIRQARKEDAGSYVCVASNIAGERESSPALLSIREKPVIINGPKDVTANENTDIVLQCQATGDPAPSIMWKKREGQIPERSQILSDHSLRIENIQVSDDGIYVCHMENQFGSEEAEARVSVQSKPSFVVTPTDKVVAVGRRLSIKCVVTGSPQPAVFWNKKNSQTFMSPNRNYGRFHVLEDGTLVIDSVRHEDAAEYTCQALSIAGTVHASLRIEVKDSDQRPPPIIYHGPQNQTLPTDGLAVMPCLASGEPVPSIIWLKGRAAITTSDPRFTVSESGTLEIKDLRLTDTGLYTCRAVSETGETSWTAGLIVEHPSKPQVVFHRTPESTTFPGAPTKPMISDVGETSVRLTWRQNINPGASPVISYTVEYFSHDTGEGWIVATDTVNEQSFIVRNLLPNTSYMFLVRAQNSHGLSLPSPVSAVIRTKGDKVQQRPTVPPLDVTLVTEKLSVQIIHMNTPEVLSSTAIKLVWEVRRNQQFIEGFNIKYRVAPDLDGGEGNMPPRYGRGHGASDYTIIAVQSSSATMYVLSELQKFTWYEVRIQPYYGTVRGMESNLFRIRTAPDRPSAPPQNIRGTQVENDTLLLTWEPPPRQHRNGILLGYKILVIANEPKLSREVQVNVSTESFYLRHLVKDVTYHIQMLAYNEVGDGERSEAIMIGRQHADVKPPLINEPWFIATLIAIVGVAVWLVLCLFSIWIYRRHKAGKKIPKNRAKPVTVHTSGDVLRSTYVANQMPLLATNVCNGSQSNTQAVPYTNGSYRGTQPRMTPCCYDNESPSDGDSKATGSLIGHTYQTLESLQHNEMVDPNDPSHSFYNRATLPVMPYATTTLVGGPVGRGVPNGGGCIPNPQAYMIQQLQPGASGDTCWKDCRGMMTDPRNEQAFQQGTQPKLFLPPPPEASEQGTLPCSEFSRLGNGDAYGLPPAYAGTEHELKRLNGSDGNRAYSDRFMDSAPVLTDPRLLDYDTYGEGNVTDAELAELAGDSMIGALAQSDGDTLSESSSQNSYPPVVDFAAELSGQNSGVFQCIDSADKGRRPTKQRQRAPRPTSPYSTDSNYSSAAAQQPRRPYPKSERRKQLALQRGLADPEQNNVGANMQGSGCESDRFRSAPLGTSKQDQPMLFTKPPVPYSTVNSSRSSHGSTTMASNRMPPAPNGGGTLFASEGEGGSRPNPLSAFDTRDTPIV